MRKFYPVGLLLLAASSVFAGESDDWSYTGQQGPEHWSESAAACGGVNQSPINLIGFIEADLAPVEFHYEQSDSEIVNTGHTIQVNVAKGNHIVVDGIEFGLLQFHFHTPSENLIKGKSFPLEVHLVHADRDGNLAVIAVMFSEGEENKMLAQLLPNIPKNPGGKAALPIAPSADGIMSPDRDYYRFNGSLTTPPCSEGVRWLVLKQPMTISSVQLQQLAAVMKPNNRPVQPTNSRVILQ